MSKYYKHYTKDEKITLLKSIKDNPEDYLGDGNLNVIAKELVAKEHQKVVVEQITLNECTDFKVFGRNQITSNAYQQMEWAMRLPIVKYGALMPDAHHGYGLPIGGVLATRNAVIPYGVGVDIGCRMSLSLYDVDANYLKRYSHRFKEALKNHTCFGAGGEWSNSQEHPVLDRWEFKATDLLKQLRGKAIRQLGSSGSGNHFVEFGLVTLNADNGLGFDAGQYLGLLTHSGSRGLGATVARYYTDMARKQCFLPKPVQHLAWLDLDSELGQAYWMSMNLAGDYAKACHDIIHKNLSKYLGIKPVLGIENHHNFAWKTFDEGGEEVIVHRKGATPAASGELGIIPGSMATAGYLVRGKGNPSSINSASHGAGRKMSRKQARSTMTKSMLKKVLSRAGVSLIGGGVDESPAAYKDLDKVMQYQQELVEVIGTFIPKIVRMDKD